MPRTCEQTKLGYSRTTILLRMAGHDLLHTPPLSIRPITRWWHRGRASSFEPSLSSTTSNSTLERLGSGPLRRASGGNDARRFDRELARCCPRDTLCCAYSIKGELRYEHRQ